MMQRVINFSGGRTSAYMVIHYWRPGDLVIFCDTGREHPKTYKFINDFEAHEQIPVIRLQFDGGWHGFLNKWNKGRNIPNHFKRECTIQLKVKTARRYLRSLGLMAYENFIGFRYDEPTRVKKHKEKWQQVASVFPLYDDKVTKEIIVAYFKEKQYDLEIPPLLGNCDACFMKGESAIIAIYAEYPELADKWISDEENNSDGRTYLKGVTHRQMLEASKKLKAKYNLNEIEPKYTCACTA